MFTEIANSAVATYHPNKNSDHQYELHKSFKNEKIGKLMKHIKKIEAEIGYDFDSNYYNRTDSPLGNMFTINSFNQPTHYT